MPRVNGVYRLPVGYLAVDGELIRPPQHNAPLEDIAAALTGSLPRDGTAPMTGNLAMGNNRMTGLAAPTQANDAARKSYVDDAVGPRLTEADANARYLRLDGGTMTGSFTMGGSTQIVQNTNPTADSHLTRRAYVDTQVNTRLTQAQGDNRYVNLSDTTFWSRDFLRLGASAGARDYLSAVPTSRRVIVGPGLSLFDGSSDNLGSDISIRMGVPSSITASSTNSADGNTHTHSISDGTIRTLIADGSAAGNVGTYAMLGTSGNDPVINAGAIVPGSRLSYAGIWTGGTSLDRTQIELGGTPSGSWRAMGRKPAYDGANNRAMSLFLRVS